MIMGNIIGKQDEDQNNLNDFVHLKSINLKNQ